MEGASTSFAQDNFASDDESSEDSSSESEEDDEENTGSDDEMNEEEEETIESDTEMNNEEKEEEDIDDDKVATNVLSNYVSSGDESSAVCPVCLNKFIGQDLGTPNSCTHTFCLECILEWSKNINTCPFDRTEFSHIHVKTELSGSVVKNIKVKVNPTQPEDTLPEDTTSCEICHRGDHEDRLLLCDACDLAYHCECLDPPLQRIPINEWFCPPCSVILNKKSKTPRSSSNQRVIPRTIASENVRLRIRHNRIGSDDDDVLEVPSLPSTSQRFQKKTVSPFKKKRRVYRRRRRKTITKKIPLARTKQSVLINGKFRTYLNVTTTRKVRRRRKRRKIKKQTKKTLRTKRSLLASRPLPAPSTKQRIADLLGLRKPPSGHSAPYVKASKSSEKASKSKQNTFTLFGNGDELMDFEEDFTVENDLERPTKSSSSPLACSSTFNLLDNIMAGQNLLHERSQNITICKDGSLKLKENNKNEVKRHSSINKNSSFENHSHIKQEIDKNNDVLVKSEISESTCLSIKSETTKSTSLSVKSETTKSISLPVKSETKIFKTSPSEITSLVTDIKCKIKQENVQQETKSLSVSEKCFNFLNSNTLSFTFEKDKNFNTSNSTKEKKDFLSNYKIPKTLKTSPLIQSQTNNLNSFNNVFSSSVINLKLENHESTSNDLIYNDILNLNNSNNSTIIEVENRINSGCDIINNFPIKIKKELEENNSNRELPNTNHGILENTNIKDLYFQTKNNKIQLKSEVQKLDLTDDDDNICIIYEKPKKRKLIKNEYADNLPWEASNIINNAGHIPKSYDEDVKPLVKKEPPSSPNSNGNDICSYEMSTDNNISHKPIKTEVSTLRYNQLLVNKPDNFNIHSDFNQDGNNHLLSCETSIGENSLQVQVKTEVLSSNDHDSIVNETSESDMFDKDKNLTSPRSCDVISSSQNLMHLPVKTEVSSSCSHVDNENLNLESNLSDINSYHRSFDSISNVHLEHEIFVQSRPQKRLSSSNVNFVAKKIKQNDLNIDVLQNVPLNVSDMFVDLKTIKKEEFSTDISCDDILKNTNTDLIKIKKEFSLENIKNESLMNCIENSNLIIKSEPSFLESENHLPQIKIEGCLSIKSETTLPESCRLKSTSVCSEIPKLVNSFPINIKSENTSSCLYPTVVKSEIATETPLVIKSETCSIKSENNSSNISESDGSSKIDSISPKAKRESKLHSNLEEPKTLNYQENKNFTENSSFKNLSKVVKLKNCSNSHHNVKVDIEKSSKNHSVVVKSENVSKDHHRTLKSENNASKNHHMTLKSENNASKNHHRTLKSENNLFNTNEDLVIKKDDSFKKVSQLNSSEKLIIKVKNDANNSVIKKIKLNNEDLEKKIEKEVKKSLWPFYKAGLISKAVFYDIQHKCVPKILKNCNGSFNPEKIAKLVCAYVNVAS